jgi:kumamolisin
MKRCLFLVLIALVIMVVAASGFAQDYPAEPVKGTIVAPPSTLNQVHGRIHTPLYIFIPAEGMNPGSIPNGETPASIACIYGVTPPTTGCPKNGRVIPNGGAGAIALVGWGHSTKLQSDLNAFSDYFGLPRVTVEEICSPAPPCPISDGTGWDLEAALDVEWAHAMAPHARIIFSTSPVDPFRDGAEAAAGAAVAAAGGGEVSNSWSYDGPYEFKAELDYDRDMQTPRVVYFASAGDSGLRPAYPSVSPYVVSAGGTHINRDDNGNFTGTERCWSHSGGGISMYESIPHYQFTLLLPSRRRGTPDLAAVADPYSGVLVYNTSLYLCGGWCIVGGTSASSPILAGIVNAAGGFQSNTDTELTKTYGEYGIPMQYHAYFFDITTGNNGAPARLGWDQCTGIGTPRKLAGL